MTRPDLRAGVAPPVRSSSDERPVTAGGPPVRTTDTDGRMTPSARKILAAIAYREQVVGEDATSRKIVGALAGISKNSSTRDVEIGRLSRVGLVEVMGEGRIRLTAAGRDLADTTAIPSTRAELWRQFEERMPPSAQRMFRELLAIYPDDIARADLGERAGISPTASTRDVELGRMANLGVVETSGKARVRASAVLFPEGMP